MNNFPNQKSFFINEKVTYNNTIMHPDTPIPSRKNENQFPNYPTYINNIKSSYPEAKTIEKQIYNNSSTVNFNNGIHNYQSSGYQNVNQNVHLSKSYVKKDSGTSEIELILRDLRQKIFKVNKTLHQHQQQIIQIKQSRVSINSVNNHIIDNTLNSKVSLNLEKQDQLSRFPLIIQKEIEKLRLEIFQQFIKKDEFQYKINLSFNQIQNKMNDKLINIEQVTDARLKSLDFRKQFQTIIMNIHETNRTIFNKIEKDMIDCRLNIQNTKNQIIGLKSSIQQNQKINFITSNKMFYSPKIIKYKETIQLLNGSPTYEKQSEIIINQLIYYLDKEGYLLDKSFYYLLDITNKPIQLDEKHLNLMKYHNILQ